MDIAQEVLKHGNIWAPAVNSHFENYLEPFHAAQSGQFVSTVKVENDVKYGSDARHRLDIYKPISATATSALPVVVYFHGGAFVAGDNQITKSMHGNIGNYFASQGCIGVLATYRILPTAAYPEGAEDVASVISWLSKNIAPYGGNASRIFPIGQSAGGANLAIALCTGLLKDQIKNIGGIILQSAPLWYNLKLDRRRANMLLYHRTESEDEVLTKTSVSNFEKCSEEEVKTWPRVLTTVGEYDPNEIVDGNLQFVAAYRRKMKKLPLFEVMEGHNHISYALGIGLPGDLVGPRILAFVSQK